jgi:hypothetical protein
MVAVEISHLLEPLVPPGLTLDTYDEHWGFVVIAVVQTRNLRPAFRRLRIITDA